MTAPLTILKRGKREHRDRFYLSCSIFGRQLGDMLDAEVWVLDGKVYAIGSHRVEDLGDYFLFMEDARAGKHPNFTSEES